MESNTPPAYQRNRRAGRITPLAEEPSAASAMAQPAQPQPVQQPAVQPVRSAYPQQAPTAAPAYPRQAQQTMQPRQAYSAGLSPAHQQHPSGNRPPRALQQTASDWRMPAQQSPAYRSPAPQPRPQNHAAPRTAGPARPQAASAAPKPSASRARTPSWLLTLLSLSAILVMALLAFDFLMQAYLKTAADEKQTAYEAILQHYHVTEEADGSLRVTWQETIEHYAEQYNLQPAFVTAIIRNESSFRTEAVSSAGARGLMQMMPDTAEWVAGKLNDSYDFDRLFDPETSIRYGCWYLNYLSELFRGDPVLVSAAYHAGQGEVWGWLGNPAISPDGVTVPIENIPISNTKTYAGRVTQAYGIYQTLLYPENAFPASAAAEPHDGGAAAGSCAAAAR